ncbi:hypothetical protein ABT127_34165 [Streptomyces sp. NPDC001904]|uniref:hypothetical protein n=1 Tax=Streptomyces sp. NPDC001904 TaxID=3154531 RepID=UPI00332D9D25
MAVLPLDATAGQGPARPAPSPVRPPGRPSRRPRAASFLPPLAVLLALLLIGAAQGARPHPFGDHLAREAAGSSVTVPALRADDGAVEAYDAEGTRWRHTREGRRALAVLPAAGHAFALWSDGLVTDTERRTAAAVRWHRAVPDAAPWLRTPEAHGGAGVLQPLDPAARMLAVVTPQRIAAYRTVDGDLRWVLPAREGCAFAPATTARRGTALLVAQPCTGHDAAWTDQIVAIDDLGGIAPHRTPLGNELPGERPDPRAGRAGKALASHR